MLIDKLHDDETDIESDVNSDPDFTGSGGRYVGSPQQIVGVSGFGGTLNVVLVANDADTRKLESDGWIKIHENILVGR